jgi:molecular chaperone GrpE
MRRRRLIRRWKRPSFRRAARDIENAHKYALERFTGELLPVVDNLERAIESTEEALVGHEAAEAVAEGVKLSLKLFLDTLEKAGVVQLEPHGEPFDPQFHEAMSVVENADVEPGTVIHVVQKGYTLNGRLIRAAMVMVSKAP